MLALDNSLLSDYLVGRDAAEAFLDDWSEEPWMISSIVQYEAYAGSLYGHREPSFEAVESAITSSMEVADVTAATAKKAAELQAELLDRGVPAESPDIIIAANAAENGATLATSDQFFWQDEVQEVLSVAEYRRNS